MLKDFYTDIRHRVEYAFLRTLFIFIENLPIRVAYFLGKCMGQIAFWFGGKRKRQIYKNLEQVFPHGIPFPKEQFAQKVFTHFCLVFIEFLLAQRLLHLHNWREIIDGPGIDFLYEQHQKTDRMVVTTGHIGNFEIAGHASVYTGTSSITVIQPLRNPYLNSYLVLALQHSDHEIVAKKGVFSILKDALERGVSPTLVADQHAGKGAPYVDFLGKKAYSPAGPASLARHFDIPMITGALFRTGLFRFSLYVEEIPLPEFTEDREKDIEKITATLNQYLAKYIYMYPEQWFWMHRRWR